MSDLFGKTIQLFTGGTILPPAKKRPLKKYTERDLLRMESAIGRDLFGPTPDGHQREFFCLDARTWIWYESWIDETTKEVKEQTTRFEAHTNGIIKIQEGQPYKVLEGIELKNLEAAVEIYYERVVREVYHCDPVTGKPLPSAPAS